MAIDLKPLPNKEALEFWKSKVQMSPKDFFALSEAAKTRAFAVSGIAKGSELESVFEGLLSAMENGDTYQEFKTGLSDVWERRGWTGLRAWRIDNIFRTNIQTAFHAGRYNQMMQVAETRPYWMYDAVNDSRTRPTHRALDGKIYRSDNPFWDSWYPPNGFRCRCGVTTLSAAEIKRDGLTVSDKNITGTLVEPTTPDGIKMPGRLLMPDPGFDHNSAKAYWDGVVDNATATDTWQDLPGLVKELSKNDTSFAEINPTRPTRLLPKGKPADWYEKEFTALYGTETVITDAAGEPVVVSLRALSGFGDRIPIIRDVIERPDALHLIPQKSEKNRVRLVRRYISGDMTAEVSGGVWLGWVD